MKIKHVNWFILLGMVLLLLNKVAAHPMPNSVLSLSISDEKIQIKIEVPVQEFELALKENLLLDPNSILPKYSNQINNYFLAHLKIRSDKGLEQEIKIKNTQLLNTAYDFGAYLELVIDLECSFEEGFNNRDFFILYDGITHQVSNHFTLIKLNRDFTNGITPEDTLQFGIIELDRASNTIKPLHVSLEKGSNWKGFKKIVVLGMHHIQKGIDHLLFLLLLIIISPLIYKDKKWLGFGGWRYTFFRLIKIITAFTLGHTITLCLFSIFDLNGFSKYIEIAIATTIIFTAAHTIKPLIANKESYITFFFGLIHGSAFGITLNEWGLSNHQKFLSLLGFNLGIEFMQLILVIVCIPLIYFCKFPQFKFFRYVLANLTIIVSFAWLIERIEGKANLVSTYLNNLI